MQLLITDTYDHTAHSAGVLQACLQFSDTAAKLLIEKELSAQTSVSEERTMWRACLMAAIAPDVATSVADAEPVAVHSAFNSLAFNSVQSGCKIPACSHHDVALAATATEQDNVPATISPELLEGLEEHDDQITDWTFPGTRCVSMCFVSSCVFVCVCV